MRSKSKIMNWRKQQVGSPGGIIQERQKCSTFGSCWRCLCKRHKGRLQPGRTDRRYCIGYTAAFKVCEIQRSCTRSGNNCNRTSPYIPIPAGLYKGVNKAMWSKIREVQGLEWINVTWKITGERPCNYVRIWRKKKYCLEVHCQGVEEDK